jgi:hypothetical protein
MGSHATKVTLTVKSIVRRYAVASPCEAGCNNGGAKKKYRSKNNAEMTFLRQAAVLAAFSDHQWSRITQQNILGG